MTRPVEYVVTVGSRESLVIAFLGDVGACRDYAANLIEQLQTQALESWADGMTDTRERVRSGQTSRVLFGHLGVEIGIGTRDDAVAWMDLRKHTREALSPYGARS